MLSCEIKPQSFMHVSKSKNLSVYHVVDIYLSSHVVERHIFSNSRKCKSFICHCSYIMPSFNRYGNCLSYDTFTIFADELDNYVSFL